MVNDDARQTILAYVEDVAREFGDRASLKSSTSRLVNLYRASGLSLAAFIARLYEARAITKDRSSSIRSGRFPYFVSVLEDLLGLKQNEALPPPTS
jgi:hypothetical protein